MTRFGHEQQRAPREKKRAAQTERRAESLKIFVHQDTYFPQIVIAASRSMMVITLGRLTFTSNFGKTKAK